MTIDPKALTRVFDDLDPFEWERRGEYSVRKGDYAISVAAGSPSPILMVWHKRRTDVFPEGTWGMVSGPFNSIAHCVKFVEKHREREGGKAMA